MKNIVTQGRNVIRAHLRHLADHGQDEYFREALAYLVDHDINIPEEFLEAPCGCSDAAASQPGSAGCPGSRVMNLEPDAAPGDPAATAGRPSRLRQWPVQIMLVPPQAPFLKGADLLIAADCVPFAYADFHDKLLAGKVLLVGCPKLDDARLYLDKLTEIFRDGGVASVTVAHMEVPCCFGMVRLVESAIEQSGRSIPFEAVTISVKGEKI
jgi:hypothetical protein